jgi:nicotinamide-nucleotide adenylyltransferase
MVNMRSVFIGRFQPIHKGHLHTIKQILDREQDPIIVIGSSQYSHTPDNPFSGGERVHLIKRTLIAEDLPLERIDIIPLSDIHIHPLWVSHLKSFVPPFDLAYTHNPLVRRLLKDAGIEVDETDLLKRKTYSGSHIRALIRRGDDWEPLVPPVVAELIKDLNLDERIREVGETTTKR